VSREHRRAKTDRLDTETLMRAFLGWLRGEVRHCRMAAIPTPERTLVKRRAQCFRFITSSSNPSRDSNRCEHPNSSGRASYDPGMIGR
jgi:transposase